MDNMSMDMSDLGGASTELDYTSFERQHIYYNHRARGGASGNTEVTAQLDPLEGQAGLDQNEVAELVALVAPQIQVAADGYEAQSNSSPGNIDFRGVFGLNLQDKRDQVLQGADVDRTGDVIQENDGGDASGGPRIISKNEDGILWSFDVTAEVGFKDGGSSAGGSGGGHQLVTYPNVDFRELYGRGPIVDSADELGFVTTNNKNGVGYFAENTIRMTAVWDVATVDDAGRQFGIPSEMR